MLFTILWLPLLGFIAGSLFGHYIGRIGTVFFTTFNIFLTFVFAFNLFKQQLIQNTIYVFSIAPWILTDNLNIYWEIQLDSVNIILMCVVTFISTIVHFYSAEYMQHDPHLPRFMAYLSLFTFFMLILITGSNFLQMFVGWEGVGLASYLLINFWFTRLQANKAAIKAMLFNRIADLMLLIAFFTNVMAFETLDYTIIFTSADILKNMNIYFLNQQYNVIDFICIFLFLGAMGKSAQIGFHNWLPDAMEGPTPVSALIHAATMVTAGVFLLVRCSPLFELSTPALIFVSIIGALTAVFGASIGFFVNDLKRVIAFSTCSQLGYMMMACGISQYSTALFHLTTHAFFKALLFLAAGSIIHASFDEQDTRKLGGLIKFLPLTYICFLIGSLNLSGFPFLSGFYTKDIILEQTYSTYTTIGWFCYSLGILAAFLTAAYSMRLLLLVFLVRPNQSIHFLYTTFENKAPIKYSLIILAFVSIIAGNILTEIFYGFGTTFYSQAIFFNQNTQNIGDIEFLTTSIKSLPLIVTFFGIFFSILYYTAFKKYFILLKIRYKNFYAFFNKKWFFDRIANQIFGSFSLNWALYYTYVASDRGLLEIFGPTTICRVTETFLNATKRKKINQAYYY